MSNVGEIHMQDAGVTNSMDTWTALSLISRTQLSWGMINLLSLRRQRADSAAFDTKGS